MYKYFLFYLFFFASSSTYAQNAEWRHIHQGNRAFVKGDYKTAEFEYRAAQKLNPQSARAAFNLGDVYLAQRNMQAALEQYQVAAKGESNKFLRALSYHNVGVAYHLNKQYDKAIDFYKEALRNNPHDEDTRYNLVLCQKQKKEDQQQQNQQQQQKSKQPEKQNNQQQSQQQQQETNREMSKESAERLLNLAQQAEKQTRDKLQRSEQPRQKHLKKNW
jgi:batC protein